MQIGQHIHPQGLKASAQVPLKTSHTNSRTHTIQVQCHTHAPAFRSLPLLFLKDSSERFTAVSFEGEFSFPFRKKSLSSHWDQAGLNHYTHNEHQME